MSHACVCHMSCIMWCLCILCEGCHGIFHVAYKYMTYTYMIHIYVYVTYILRYIWHWFFSFRSNLFILFLTQRRVTDNGHSSLVVNPLLHNYLLTLCQTSFFDHLQSFFHWYRIAITFLISLIPSSPLSHNVSIYYYFYISENWIFEINSSFNWFQNRQPSSHICRYL